MIVCDMALLKALPGKFSALRAGRAVVGVLEDTNERSRSMTRAEKARSDRMATSTPSDQTNAEIGYRHEFGEGKIPQRSFIRVPLMDNLGPRLAAPEFKTVVEGFLTDTASRDEVLGYMAEAAEDTIDEAFETGGSGKWPALAASTIKSKGSDEILVETTQLRHSITSRVLSK
mgnify:CR=1 FL=1